MVPKWHTRPILCSLLFAGACAPGAPGGEGPEEVLLRPGGDILAVAETVAVRDSVPGDVMIGGSTASFEGSAEGSVLAVGSTVDAVGVVAGSVRALGATVQLDARVGRNATLAGGRIEVRSDAVVDRNAYLAGNEVRIDGSVAGDVYVGGSDVAIDGSIEGDVRVEASTLRIGPDARIGGELRYRVDADEPAVISPQAEIAGGVQELAPREAPGPRLGFRFLRLLSFLFTGVVLVALLPSAWTRSARATEASPASAAGSGLLVLFLGPFVLTAVAVTAVGLPLALTGFATFFVLLYLAPIVPSLWLGSRILGSDSAGTSGAMVKAFVAGGVIVAFAILLPWVGMVARIAATVLGLGGMLLALRGGSRAPSTSASMAPPTATPGG